MRYRCIKTESVHEGPALRSSCLAWLLVLVLVSFQSLVTAATDSATNNNVVLVGDAPPPNEPLTLWYRQPALKWVEALAVGNGRLGAMVFGGANQERLQLNEDTLWAGGPYDPVNPEALGALPEVRRLILDGKYREADRLISAKVMAKPLAQMPYQTVGDLLLDFPEVNAVEDY